MRTSTAHRSICNPRGFLGFDSLGGKRLAIEDGDYRILNSVSSIKYRILKTGKDFRQARKAKGLTLNELGGRVGTSAANLSSIERGEWGPSKSLQLNLQRELVGEVREPSGPYGFAVPTGVAEDIPVVGRGRGGRGQFNVDGYPVGEGYKRVRRPYDVADPQAFGVEVFGDSMAPRYEEGDVVICSPAKRWRSGDYCVVIKEDGEALVKKIKEQGDMVILSSLAPGYDPVMLHKKEIRAIHKIVWRKER
jgi:phage repressor protein C with HTH and peptisase S24 domain